MKAISHLIYPAVKTATRKLAAVAAVLITILGAPIVRAQVLVDDFDDNVISSQIWNISTSGFGPEVVAANQRVEIWIPSYSSGSMFIAAVAMNFCLEGDYDIQVDFDLPLFPYQNGVRVAVGADGAGVATERTSLAPGDFVGYPRDVYLSDGYGGVQGLIGTGDLSGTLRQVRTGDMISSYYWDSVNLGWQAISTVLASGVDANPVFKAWSADGTFQNMDVLVAFDNFRINSGRICGPACVAQVQPPINADGSSVWTVRRGVVPVKFSLTCDDSPICDLSPATIGVTRTAGGTQGAINESLYSMAADTGSNFRIDGCQYIYNLNSGALGVGTYRVDIRINNQVVGSATFQLK